MAYLGGQYDWLQGMPRPGTLPSGGIMGGQPGYPGDPNALPIGAPLKGGGLFAGGSMPTGGWMGGQPGYPGDPAPLPIGAPAYGGGYGGWGGNPNTVRADMGGGNTGLMAGVSPDPAPGVMGVSAGSYLQDPAYQRALKGGGWTGGPAGPTSNYLSPGMALPPGFSWDPNGRDISRNEGTPFNLGDPYSIGGWSNDINPDLGHAITNYQYWNRFPGSISSNEIGGIGAILSPMTGGISSAVAPIVEKGIGGPSPAQQTPYDPSAGNNMPYDLGGGSSGGGLFDNLLGTLGNLSPAILAGYLGNSQRQDVMGQVGRLNDLGASLSGPAFMNSITNPYDLQTGAGRTALSQNLQQRGVGGSSFGNQQLGNYDYMRGLGRGDLATRAQAGIAGTQGQLYSNALHGLVGSQAAYNQLLGAGLGASGSLFNRTGAGSTGNGLFDWLRNLYSGTGGTPIPTDNPYPTTDPSGQGGQGLGNDPNIYGPPTEFDPNIDWSNLYG